LLRKFANYDRKKFFNIGTKKIPWCNKLVFIESSITVKSFIMQDPGPNV